MKQRDIFRVPARVEKKEDEWFIVLRLGFQEFAFVHGEKLELASPMATLIIEFEAIEAKE